MNAVEFLARPRLAQACLERARQRENALRALTERVTGKFGLGAEPVSHSRNNTAMQDAIAAHMEAEGEVERLKEELAAVELEVGMVLAKLPAGTLYEFMVRKYLDLEPVGKIAEEMNYSYSWGRWELEKGITEVQRILDDMEASGESPVMPEN